MSAVVVVAVDNAVCFRQDHVKLQQLLTVVTDDDADADDAGRRKR